MAVLTRRDLARSTSYRSRPAADFWLRVHRRAMACRFEVTLAGEDAADLPAARRALDRVDDIESQLTVFRESSAVSKINRTAAIHAVEVDQDLFELLALCETLHVETSGAFDVTSTPLSRCWGFLRRGGRLPETRELAAARALVGMHHVRIDRVHRAVHFDREGVEVNFGAVGKGWALDDVARTLRADGVQNALLSAGRSSVRAIGGQGEGWHVRLTSPRVERPLAEVFLRDAAIGTSGAGEQFFEIDGQRYGHVIDPRTGWPAEGALSVSVITTSAAIADALSTAFFVGGQDLARAYCASHANVLVVFTPDDEERRTVLIGDFDGADVEAV